MEAVEAGAHTRREQERVERGGGQQQQPPPPQQQEQEQEHQQQVGADAVAVVLPRSPPPATCASPPPRRSGALPPAATDRQEQLLPAERRRLHPADRAAAARIAGAQREAEPEAERGDEREPAQALAPRPSDPSPRADSGVTPQPTAAAPLAPSPGAPEIGGLVGVDEVRDLNAVLAEVGVADNAAAADQELLDWEKDYATAALAAGTTGVAPAPAPAPPAQKRQRIECPNETARAELRASLQAKLDATRPGPKFLDADPAVPYIGQAAAQALAAQYLQSRGLGGGLGLAWRSGASLADTALALLRALPTQQMSEPMALKFQLQPQPQQGTKRQRPKRSRPPKRQQQQQQQQQAYRTTAPASDRTSTAVPDLPAAQLRAPPQRLQDVWRCRAADWGCRPDPGLGGAGQGDQRGGALGFPFASPAARRNPDAKEAKAAAQRVLAQFSGEYARYWEHGDAHAGANVSAGPRRLQSQPKARKQGGAPAPLPAPVPAPAPAPAPVPVPAPAPGRTGGAVDENLMTVACGHCGQHLCVTRGCPTVDCPKCGGFNGLQAANDQLAKSS